MRTRRSFAALASLMCATALGGCAKTADQIEPAARAAFVDIGATCADLDRQNARVGRDLIFAGIAQNQVAREDRERLFGVAPSMFGTLFRGDLSDRIAELKAGKIAISAQAAALDCVSQL